MIQDIKIDGIEIDLYWWYVYIMENRNGDIIIFNYELKIVVGMNSLGGSWFMYLNLEEEFIRGICIDKYGYKFVDYDICINFLDEDGIFQKKLLRNMLGKFFISLCLDDK